MIKIPRLLKLDTFVGPHPTIPTPLPSLIWHCEEYVFQNQGIPCNYWLREEETKHQGLMCSGGRLRLFADGLWSFVVVYGCLWLLAVLVTMPVKAC